MLGLGRPRQESGFHAERLGRPNKKAGPAGPRAAHSRDQAEPRPGRWCRPWGCRLRRRLLYRGPLRATAGCTGGRVVLGPEGGKDVLEKRLDCVEGGGREGRGAGGGGKRAAGRGARARSPLPARGPAPTLCRTKSGCTCGGAGARDPRRARTWVSAASSAAPSAAPAATKMARSGDAGGPMSHGGGGPRNCFPVRSGRGRGRRRARAASGGSTSGHRGRGRGRSGGRAGRGRPGAGGAGAAAEAEAVAAAGGPRAGPAGCHGDRPLPRARRRPPKPRPGSGARSPAPRAPLRVFLQQPISAARVRRYFIIGMDAFLFL